MHLIDPSTAAPFTGEVLRTLREEVGPETAVLGFVGCPYTLATYLVEGKTSKEYLEIKKMMLQSGLEDIKFSEHSPFWCAVGKKSKK